MKSKKTQLRARSKTPLHQQRWHASAACPLPSLPPPPAPDTPPTCSTREACPEVPWVPWASPSTMHDLLRRPRHDLLRRPSPETCGANQQA
eukprot:364495-Chlamydomonas_euryale.AAC.15